MEGRAAWGALLWALFGVAWAPYLGWGLFGVAQAARIAVATLVLHLVYGLTLGTGMDRAGQEGARAWQREGQASSTHAETR